MLPVFPSFLSNKNQANPMTLIFDYFSYPKTISPYPGCLDSCIYGSKLHMLPVFPSFLSNKNQANPMTLILTILAIQKLFLHIQTAWIAAYMAQSCICCQCSPLSLATKIKQIQ